MRQNAKTLDHENFAAMRASLQTPPHSQSEAYGFAYGATNC